MAPAPAPVTLSSGTLSSGTLSPAGVAADGRSVVCRFTVGTPRGDR